MKHFCFSRGTAFLFILVSLTHCLGCSDTDTSKKPHLSTPRAPSALTATATSTESIALSWEDNADEEEGLYVERRNDDGSFERVVTLGPDHTSFSDSGLAADTHYTYRVQAFNVRGVSAYSNEADARTIAAYDGDDAEAICADSPQLCTTAPLLIETFQSIGVYWNPPPGAAERVVQVTYRPQGATDWMRGHDLWFDTRNEGAIANGPEYRGSIVLLEEGTTYEVGLILYDADQTVLAAALAEVTTWGASFPVVRTVYVDDRHETYTISDSGSDSGYVLYTPSPLAEGIIDVQKNHDYNIEVAGGTHHIIIRGFSLRGARDSGINLATSGSHDIVIEHNDISHWGTVDQEYVYSHIRPKGVDYQAGICSRWTDRSLERVIIQYNTIHDPDTRSLSWAEVHPNGPQGIFLKDTAGRHVIRYNDVYTDYDHAFNDCIGGNNNFSDAGFPNRDSDIYGNYISGCYDDGIESEGSNRNVRIWNNYIDNSYHKLAATVTHNGPLYIWRNVGNRSRYLECPLEPHVRCIPEGETYFEVELCNHPDDPVLFMEVDELPNGHYEIRCRDTSDDIVRTVRTTEVDGCTGPNDRVGIWIPRRMESCEVIKDAQGHVTGFVQAESDVYNRGSFLKTSNNDSWGGGRVYLYHNTQLQQTPQAPNIYRLGSTKGPGRSNDGIYNHIARNNIFTSSLGAVVFDDAGDHDNDYDYNLFTLSDEPEATELQVHGIALDAFTFPEMTISLDIAQGSGSFTCQEGEDAGERLFNFNDGYHGAGPDMGACEIGSVPIRFGVSAGD